MRSRRFLLAVLTVLAVGAIAAGIGNSIGGNRAESPSAGELETASRNAAVVSESPNRPVSPPRPVADAPAPSPVPAPEKPARPRYDGVLIQEVPHVRQKPDFCGEACVAMYLGRLGRPVDQDWVFDQSGLDPLEARGCYTKELAAALGNIGFSVGPVWHKLPAAKADKSLEALFGDLHADLAAAVPSIICTRYDEKPNSPEHFRLILGYDAESDEVIYHEPAEADGAYRRMKRAQFLSLWPLNPDAKEWTVIRLRLKPGQLRRGTAATTFTAADYGQHMMKLKPKIPGEGFTVVIQPPFVVIGDESPDRVKRRSVQTVKWAVDKLKQSYFQKEPTEILDIWLFKDKTSYEKHAVAIFKHKPTTPYGYYSHTDRALVMNIATGGGTLVHEIVHPFVAANFPGCPAWLNEGLGSLYEQCGEVDGRIQGRTNWRLAGLQDAIRKKRLPSFQSLCSTTDHQFYHRDSGTNYAQARYLCYYLEQHGLLRKFYHRFCANRAKDPGGYDTLKEILQRDDLKVFQKEWEAWVLKLRFP